MNLFNQKRATKSPYFLQIAPPQTGTLMARIVDRLYKATFDDELMKAMELQSYYEYDMQGLEEDKEELRNAANEALSQKNEALSQKEEALSQKEEAIRQLRISAKLLQEFGMSVEEIGIKLGKSPDEISALLK